MNISIIGGGPSGLFSALLLAQKGHQVTLYEKSKGLGRKFLLAGSSGLNITYEADKVELSKFYGLHESEFLRLFDDFSSTDFRKWLVDFGIETFVGTSNRVFPKEMSAAKILIRIRERLKSIDNFTLKTESVFVGFKDERPVISNLDKLFLVEDEMVIFALGGASYKETGSCGEWIEYFRDLDIKCNDFYPVNCGYIVNWKKPSKERLPVKNIVLCREDEKVRGELLLTEYGIEGSGVYRHSLGIAKDILDKGVSTLRIDLLPDWSEEKIIDRLSGQRGKSSFTNFLRKKLNLNKGALFLILELIDKELWNEPISLARKLKGIEVKLTHSREINEAISTGGGIDYEEVNECYQLKKYPQFCVLGEMIDWVAPTGGFLLQGCFSQAFFLANRL